MKKIAIIILLATSFLMCGRIGNQSKSNQKVELFSINTLFSGKDFTDNSCYRIPALITAPSGDLIAVADERVASCGDLKWNRDVNIVMRRSTDNGNTWSEIERIVDYPLGQSASDASMILDKTTNTIFLFFNYMDLDNEKDVFYLRFIKSTDNGLTWSKPVDITSQITKPSWKNHFKFITSGRGIQTSNGKLIHTLVNLTEGLYLFGSDDHGESWYLIDKSIKPADESKIIELEDGRWMVNSRVKDLGSRYIYLSSDEGKTWQSFADTTLTDPACNASLIWYEFGDKKALLFSNANNAKERKNMTIRVSFDEGKNWPITKKIFNGSAAYSSITVLSNGDIGLFFEKDDYQNITFVRLTWEELLNKSKLPIIGLEKK